MAGFLFEENGAREFHRDMPLEIASSQAPMMLPRATP
jgi:hypothetical protein